jgi:hypothetical protein
VQFAVHQRHLELVLEIADGPESPHHEVRTDLVGEVGQQAVERFDLDPVLVVQNLREKGDPLLYGEERVLRVALSGRSDLRDPSSEDRTFPGR